MQDGDLFAFMAIFRNLIQLFPKRMDEADVEKLSRAYFNAMRRFTIPQIQAGADAWTQRGKFFPKPAEWMEAIPRRPLGASEALTPLHPADAAEYLDAERRGYEGDPCSCRSCQGADVSHRFLRFVPESDVNGIDVKGLIGTRVVVRGHWAHGQELARFYAARDAFWTAFTALLGKRTMSKVNAQPEPEPVEVA